MAKIDIATKVVNKRLIDSINVKDFGAVCDGVTDDTAAVQNAIDYSISFITPLVNGQGLVPVIRVSGMCRITYSLKIDRVEGGQTGLLRIVGDGVVGGFLTTSGITLFSTNLVGNTEVTKSTLVSFEGLTLQGSSVVPSFFLDAEKFVRVNVVNCFFRQMQLASSKSYFQSLYIRECFVRESLGSWMTASDLLDVKVTGSLFEVNAGTIIVSSGVAAGSTFSENLIQNNQGGFVQLATANGVNISNNYAEANALPFVSVSSAFGVSAIGNYVNTRSLSPNNLADSDFYEIKIGNSIGFFGASNHTNGRLYKVSGPIFKANIGAGDVAKLGLVNHSLVHEINGELVVSKNSNGRTATLGGGVFYRTDSRRISKNTDFISIDLGESSGAALIKVICSGVQPGIGHVSIIKEWFATRKGAGAITLTLKQSQDTGTTSSVVLASTLRSRVILSYVYSGSEVNSFNSVVSVEAVSDDVAAAPSVDVL